VSAVIRQDLELTAVDADHDGTQAYVLHDPTAGRYYRLSTPEVELLRGPLDPPADAAARVEAALGRALPPGMVDRFVAFLRQHDLLVGTGAETRLLAKARQQRGSPAQRLVRSYLFLRLPLFRPDRFLEATYWLVGWLLTPAAAVGAALLGVIGCVLVTHQWDAFVGSFLYFLNWEGALAYGFVLFGVKAIHELGHAYTAKKHGARVFTQGIAFMVFWPVFYTDTSDSWRLKSRAARLEIAAAGIRIELMLAAFCLFLWSFLEDGPTRSVVFLLATSTWIMTLVVNLNPLMKFDGYFILADALNMENVQDRALALWTWRRHRTLWGLADPPPEPPRRWLSIYAVLIWLYRFSLTLGVALIVYEFVFKLLGLLLLALQLTLFIGLPVMKDLAVVVRRRTAVRPIIVARTAVVAAALVALAAWPLPYQVDAPALQLPRIETIYAPVDARVEVAPAPAGAAVNAGQALLRLEAPELSYQLAEAEREIEVLRWQLSVLGLEARIAGRAQIIEAELRTTLDKRRGLLEQHRRLTMIATFAGDIGERAAGLTVGSWVGAGDPLLTLVDATTLTTTAYVSEVRLSRISIGTEGRFYPADGAREPVRVTIRAIDQAALREVDQALMASPNGGSVPARALPDGRLVPTTAVYRVQLDAPAVAGIGGMVIGRVVLNGTPESLLAGLWRRARGVVRRELAF
jgi:putative peptide zinc metalloprotease protein